jgi:hypothetical protein
MLLLSGFEVGQHVIARRDLASTFGPFGDPAVRKGTRGIVREPPGWFSDRYEVEFASGVTRPVSARDLCPALYGHGEDAWRRYRANRAGVRLGLFLLFGLPGAIAVLRYYLAGGTTQELVAALPMAILEEIVGLGSALGAPVVLALLAGIWLWRKVVRR